jgi:hypothetical protein
MKSKILIAVILCMPLVMLCCAPAQATTPIQPEVGCVIRNAGCGWALVTGAHKPLNVRSVTNDNTRITVTYNFTAKYVITSAVTVDETMAAEGYTVGASVGLGYTYIYIYKDGALVNPNDYANASGNIWVYGLYETG